MVTAETAASSRVAAAILVSVPGSAPPAQADPQQPGPDQVELFLHGQGPRWPSGEGGPNWAK